MQTVKTQLPLEKINRISEEEFRDQLNNEIDLYKDSFSSLLDLLKIVSKLLNNNSNFKQISKNKIDGLITRKVNLINKKNSAVPESLIKIHETYNSLFEVQHSPLHKLLIEDSLKKLNPKENKNRNQTGYIIEIANTSKRY